MQNRNTDIKLTVISTAREQKIIKQPARSDSGETDFSSNAVVGRSIAKALIGSHVFKCLSQVLHIVICDERK